MANESMSPLRKINTDGESVSLPAGDKGTEFQE
jgi:hypothetical protein